MWHLFQNGHDSPWQFSGTINETFFVTSRHYQSIDEKRRGNQDPSSCNSQHGAFAFERDFQDDKRVKTDAVLRESFLTSGGCTLEIRKSER